MGAQCPCSFPSIKKTNLSPVAAHQKRDCSAQGRAPVSLSQLSCRMGGGLGFLLVPQSDSDWFIKVVNWQFGREGEARSVGLPGQCQAADC